MFTKILANEDLLRYAPSIATNHPHHAVSNNYTFIPTIKVINTIRETGWFPVQVSEQRVRKEDHAGYQKHLIRFARENDLKTPNRIEIVLINSHNRSAAFRISIGIYRLVCSNGMVVGDEAFKYRHKHMGFDVHAFMNTIENISGSANRIQDKMEDWNTITLNKNEQGVYAQNAVKKAYNLEDVRDSIIDPNTLLIPRRNEDSNRTLWNTYNLVQEALTKGGVHTNKKTKRGKPVKTRMIRGIDRDLKVNEMLWNLTESTYQKITG